MISKIGSLLGQIQKSLIESWRRDRTTFIYELIGVGFTIAGSLLLALTAEAPNMLMIFPLYEVGSISLLCAYYRMHAVWSIMLTSYFAIINVVGFIIAM